MNLKLKKYITLENENVDEQDIFVEQKNSFNANDPVYAFTNEALNQFTPPKKYDIFIYKYNQPNYHINCDEFYN